MKAFGAYHPAVLFCYFCTVLLIGMFAANPAISLAALLGASLFCAMLTKGRAHGSNLAFYFAMFMLIAVTNPLFSHNGVTPLFFLNGNAVTLEALLYGVFLSVMILGILLWCHCYGEIMTSEKFLYLFGALIPKLSLVLSMALRFLPLFVQRMHSVSAVQKTLGQYSGKSLVGRAQNTLRVFGAVIAWSFEHAMETAASMKARGYGQKGRTHFSLFSFTVRDGVLLSVCAGLFFTVLFGIARGVCTFSFYPRIASLPRTPLACAVYIAFAVLSLLPFLIEVKEAVVWKYCVSKI